MCKDQKPAESPVKFGEVLLRLPGGALLVDVQGVGVVTATDRSGRAAPTMPVSVIQSGGAWNVV